MPFSLFLSLSLSFSLCLARPFADDGHDDDGDGHDGHGYGHDGHDGHDDDVSLFLSLYFSLSISLSLFLSLSFSNLIIYLFSPYFVFMDVFRPCLD